MKNLFDPATTAEVRTRLRHLKSDSTRQWGSMNPAQAVEHCSRGFELALNTERKHLNALIDRFAKGGPKGCTTHPHFFFGLMTPDAWTILMYKHLDHHLRQFGA
jgi:hypothetical protein